MCTLTWRGAGGRLDVFMNRDESRARPRAEPPALRTLRGARYLPPRDPQDGGAWILANEHGLVLVLANLQGRDPAAARSRGLLLWNLADANSPRDALARWEALDLSSSRPHLLHALSPTEAAAGGWTGTRRARVEADPFSGFASTSSLDPEWIPQLRRKRWDPDGDPEAFHRSHDPGPSAESVCMHRADAATASMTRVVVTPAEVSMSYADGPPCETPLGPPISLARA